MEDVKNAGGFINGGQWLEFAKAAYDLGLLYPLLTGGEPLLHPDFKEILSGMLDMGLQVSINSNGSMIDQEMAAWLGKHRPTRINITLYGASADTYQALCGNGDAFYRVRDGVRYLRENNVLYKFNTSLTPYNIQDLDQIMEFAREMGAPIQVASYMFPPVRRDESMIGKNDRFSPEEAAFARVKADYLQQDQKWFLGQTERYSRFIPIKKLEEIQKDKPEKTMEMKCRAGHCSFWVDWQGNMTNCGVCATAKRSLRDCTLEDAWKEVHQNTKDIRVPAKCASCPNQWLCHTCISMLCSECGTCGGTPEYLCRMGEASARYYREFAEKYYPEESAKIFRRVNRVEAEACENPDFAQDLCGLDGI
ncbi:MAG: radical SAM protein [Lachnospiraceae bacterium]|nr:radical SAM protein [Lachnospiraceae bacterium]